MMYPLISLLRRCRKIQFKTQMTVNKMYRYFGQALQPYKIDQINTSFTQPYSVLHHAK